MNRCRRSTVSLSTKPMAYSHWLAEIAADDLLGGRLAHDGVVADAEAGAVDPHVGGGVVDQGVLGDLFQDAPDQGKGLDVAVVVDRLDVVGLEVVVVDEVDVLQVGGGRLVGDVDRVVQGQVPDGEGLELGVAGADAAPVVVVELGEAGGQLAAARGRGR